MDETLLSGLIEIPGVSGFENNLQHFIIKELKDRGVATSQDALGNVIAKIGSGDKRVIITAHADEVGFIVTHISTQGYIYFQPVGGIASDVAVGQTVAIQTKQGAIRGVIGKLNDWATASPPPADDMVHYKNLWIDVGDNYHVRDYVTVGDPVYYDTTLHQLNNKYMLSRAADDRTGIYCILKIIDSFNKKQPAGVCLYIVITTREEVGSRGIQTATHGMSADYAISIDTVNSTDTPDSNRQELSFIELSQGPVLSRGSNTDEKLFAVFKQLAVKNKIPFQIEAQAGAMASDIDPLQIDGQGIATISVGIPIRYTHFPSSIFSWNDIDGTIDIVSAFLSNL